MERHRKGSESICNEFHWVAKGSPFLQQILRLQKSQMHRLENVKYLFFFFFFFFLLKAAYAKLDGHNSRTILYTCMCFCAYVHTETNNGASTLKWMHVASTLNAN